MPPGSFFSHATAAVLWALPVPLRVLRAMLRERHDGDAVQPPRGIDVAVHGERRGSKARGVRGHQLRRELAPATRAGGLAVTTPAATWALLGAELTVDELVALGDAIVQIPRRHGMVRGRPEDALGTIDDLRAATAAGRRRGAARLREALEEIRVGSASPGETRVRLALTRAGLPEPALDVDVFAADGSPIGFTEFAFPEHKVLVEYEGDHHRVDRAQWYRDIAKHEACAAAGWHVVRLTAADAYPRADGAVRRVRDALLRAGWRP